MATTEDLKRGSKKPVVLPENVVSVDMVNHPKHYTQHPSGVECIDVVEHMTFNLGNAVKYIWRADLKSKSPIQDLEKADWYVNREIDKLSLQGDSGQEILDLQEASKLIKREIDRIIKEACNRFHPGEKCIPGSNHPGVVNA